MNRYILRRLLQALPLLLGISVASFAILKAVPGGPLAAYEASPDITDEDIRRLEHAFGLDQPVPIQYLSWLGRFVVGDWGYSFVSHQPVLGLIGERLPNTVYLMGTVFVTVLVLAIPVGVLTAVKQYSWFDHIVTGTIFTFLSTPTFWLGLLLIIVFGLQLRWLPLGGMQTLGASFDVGDRLRHLILPVATIALVQMGSHVRFLRASMLETIGQDYMRTARAKGLSENRTMWVHVLRNASIPIITHVMSTLPGLLIGAFLVERFFSIPGIGREVILAVERSDFPVIKAITVYVAVATMIFNLLADLMYKAVDPRVQLK